MIRQHQEPITNLLEEKNRRAAIWLLPFYAVGFPFVHIISVPSKLYLPYRYTEVSPKSVIDICGTAWNLHWNKVKFAVLFFASWSFYDVITIYQGNCLYVCLAQDGRRNSRSAPDCRPATGQCTEVNILLLITVYQSLNWPSALGIKSVAF